MQVQNQQSGQVAVSWSSATTFSHTVRTTLATVKAGDCATAIATSATSATAASFTAATLRISSPVNGTCGIGGGTGGGTGQRPSGFPTGFPTGGQLPSGFPSGGRLPSGFPSGTAGRSIGAIASGKVVSVSGSSLVIAASQLGSSSKSTTDKTVTAASSTKITTEASTTASSLKVGKCVTVQGKSNTSGTVAATTVRITDPTNGSCSTGFGFGRGGNGS